MTFIPARPARDPHHVTDTPHQATLAPPHTRRYVPIPPRPHVPTPPSALPCSQPYNRTTAPYSQLYSQLYSQPYHRTTAPHPQTHTHTTQTTSTPHHSPTTQPHDPDTRRPDRRRPDAAPDATGARVAAGPPPTLAPTLARRVDVRTPPRRRPDTVTPLAVPVYSTCLLAGTTMTAGMSQALATCDTHLTVPACWQAPRRQKSVSQAPAICDTLRTAHRIPHRPTGPTLVGPPGVGSAPPPTPPTPSPSCASDTGTGQVRDRCKHLEDGTPGQAQAICDTLGTGYIAPFAVARHRAPRPDYL